MGAIPPHYSFTESGPRKGAVKPVLSRRLGIGMIRHGTEFQFMKKVGAKEFEKVIMFGPGRRIQWSVSSMPKGGH